MSTKKCPFCAEEIQAEAIFCKHCRQDLPVSHQSEQPQPPLPSTKVEKKSSSLGWKVTKWGGIYLIVAGIIIALLFLVKGPQTPTPGPGGRPTTGDPLGDLVYDVFGALFIGMLGYALYRKGAGKEKQIRQRMENKEEELQREVPNWSPPLIKKCPNCGSANPPSTLSCSCGYEFEKGIVNSKQARLREGGALYWYLAALKKYAVFSGRARPKEYWFFNLFFLPIWIVLSFLNNLGIASVGAAGALGGVYFFAMLLPSISVSVRRLHDTGRSGWWLLIPLIPLVGHIILLIFMIEDGEVGQNAYGLNPKTATVEDPPIGQ